MNWWTQWLEEGDNLDLAEVDEDDVQIDLNHPGAVLNHLDYKISILSDLDGRYNEIVTTPMRATETFGGILWVCLTSGFFHRVKLEALEPTDYFHVKFAEATMFYQGQLS